jgi:ribosomal protein S19E (S16A)
MFKFSIWSYLVICSRANELSPLDTDWLFYKAAIVSQIFVSKSTTSVLTHKKHFSERKKETESYLPNLQYQLKIIRDIVTQFKENGYVDPLANQEGSTFRIILTKTGIAELEEILSNTRNRLSYTN